jgi:L-lactate dehydrogenase
MIQRRVVGVVGAGNVGTAAAYAMFTERVASEIVLVDVNRRRAEGEAMDLAHGQALVGRIDVRAGGYADLTDAQVVVIAAGVNQAPGESRLALHGRNRAVFREVAAALDQYAPGAVLLVATNPVDLLTHEMQELSRRPRSSIIGTGTLLDTARLRAGLGARYGVSPRSVHAYILGEHGDSEVAIWSNATIGGLPFWERTVRGRPFDAAAMQALFEEVRSSANRIIERKGYTNLAIGLVIAHLADAILSDQKAVLPVSVRVDGQYGIRDVCLSLPAVIGIGGVDEIIAPDLSQEEQDALRRSAEVLIEQRVASRGST